MSVSLFTVGNTHLGKASPVKLSELNTADSETRTYSSTANYRRVNAIEQGRNRAPASATTTPEQLSDWMDGNKVPYVQWDIDANRGTAFKLTAGTTQADCGPGDECTATFTWTKPTDYEDFPSGVVQQTLWVTPCSSNTQVGCESDNPFAGNANTDRHFIYDGSPTGTTAQATGLDEDTWHTAGVRMEWNDEDSSDNPYRLGAATSGATLGKGYALDGTPGGDDTCGLCASGGPAIIFHTETAIICNGRSCGVGNSRANACSDQNGNTYAYQTNNGTLSIYDTVYSSGCSTYLTGYIAFGENDGSSYSLSSGVIQNNVELCGGNGNGNGGMS